MKGLKRMHGAKKKEAHKGVSRMETATSRLRKRFVQEVAGWEEKQLERASSLRQGGLNGLVGVKESQWCDHPHNASGMEASMGRKRAKERRTAWDMGREKPKENGVTEGGGLVRSGSIWKERGKSLCNGVSKKWRGKRLRFEA